MPSLAVDGRLEGIVDGRVLGWAWSPGSPLERIWVAVFVDGEPVGLVAADLERSDLLAAGVGDGAHGFAVPLPAELQDGEHDVRVTAGSSNVPLSLASGARGVTRPLSGETEFHPTMASVQGGGTRLGLASVPWFQYGKVAGEAVAALERFIPRLVELLERVPAWVRWATLMVVLLAFTWPFGSPTPRPGLDRSWQIGLDLAFSHGLVFGRQIIFTYGPLGFVLHPFRTSAGTYLVAVLIGGLIQLGVLAILLACLRRTVRLPIAVLVTFVLASLLGQVQADPLLAIAFGAVVLALTASEDRAEQAAQRLAIGGGALAAIAMLVKLDDGSASAAVIAVGLAGTARPRRALAQGAVSFAVALPITWLLIGQPLAALPDYLRNAYEVVRGYVEAMNKDEAGSKGPFMLVLLLSSVGALSVGAWVSMANHGRRQRTFMVLVVLTLYYFLFREMFTREGLGRGVEFALLAAVAAMIPWRGRGRLAGFAVAATLWAVTFSFYPSTPSATLVPLVRAQTMVRQLKLALGPAPRTARQAKLVKQTDVLPAPVLAAVRGHCVTVEPTEIAVIWAYQLRWCPLPALQSYNAYTSRLDHLDAAAYANAGGGPDRVLRTLPAAIDGRNPTWESPAAMLSLLCHFREVARGAEWQALARVPNRCGPLEPYTTLHAQLGKTLTIPPAPPGDLLVAAVDGLGVSFGERLTSLVARVAKRYVTLNGRRYRVPPDTAPDGFLIGVPVAADYPAPFSLDMSPRTLSASIAGHSGGAITVRLMTATISP